MHNRVALIGTIACALALLAGCTANPYSDGVEGEVVRLELIRGEERSAVLPLIASALAGAAIDAVQAQIEAEAEKLERQFGASVYASDFWTVKKKDGAADPEVYTTYKGFKIRRFTKQFPEFNADGTATDLPAMEFEADFKPSDNGRLFLIQPVRFITREAKAKVVNTDGALKSTMNFAVDAMWIDKGQMMRQERIATASFDVMNYKLTKHPKALNTDDFGGPDSRVGWFPGVPVSVKIGSDTPMWTPWPQGKDKFTDGAFKLTVFVTERDASKAKEYIERAAKFVGDQRGKVIERINETMQ